MDVLYAVSSLTLHAENAVIEMGEVVFDEAGKFKEQQYTTFGYGSIEASNNKRAFSYDKIGEDIWKGIVTYNYCDKIIYPLRWEGDSISEIFFEGLYYQLEYNSHGLVTKASATDYIMFSSNSHEKYYYSIEYSANKNINKVEKYLINGKGKSKAKVKVLFTQLLTTKTIDYKADRNEYIVHTTEFNNQKTAKDNPTLSNDTKATIVKEHNGFTFEGYSLLNLRSIIKHTYVFNDQGYLAKHVSNNYTSGMISTRILEYDGFQRAAKVIVKTVDKSGTQIDHLEFYNRHVLKAGANPNKVCSYETISTRKNFDSNGVLIYETDETGKYRKKLENGEWSPWRFYDM